jgi:hypothetical protein
MSREVVKLTAKGLKRDREDGLTNKEMAEKYNLSAADIQKALKLAGLSNSKPRAKAKFVLLDDEDETKELGNSDSVSDLTTGNTSNVITPTEEIPQETPQEVSHL